MKSQWINELAVDEMGIDGKIKPIYTEGQHVSFDFGNGVSGTGFICGLVSRHVIDFWIVEVVSLSTGTPLNYSCISVQHTCIQPI